MRQFRFIRKWYFKYPAVLVLSFMLNILLLILLYYTTGLPTEIVNLKYLVEYIMITTVVTFFISITAIVVVGKFIAKFDGHETN